MRTEIIILDLQWGIIPQQMVGGVTGGTGEAFDGLYIVTADGNGPVTWTRDLSKVAGEKKQPYVTRAILKFISGTENAGSAHIVPKSGSS